MEHISKYLKMAFFTFAYLEKIETQWRQSTLLLLFEHTFLHECLEHFWIKLILFHHQTNLWWATIALGWGMWDVDM